MLVGTLADAVWTTYQPSANPPNWNSVLPTPVTYSENIRPSAPGDLTENERYPTTGQNWDKVDETPPDELITYILNTSKWEHTDLYNLSDPAEDMPISSITIYFRIAGGPSTIALAKPAIKTNETVFLGPQQSQASGTFDTKSFQWTNNPATNQPWTTPELNQLQAGVALTKPSGGTYVACTQVYVQVNYDFLVTQGELPQGDIFNITPAEAYTGDLNVKIYLTNTAALLKAYQYINMKLYMANSIEAGNNPDYLVLSIENGLVSFNIEGDTAPSYVVRVAGGSYRLVSDNTSNWGEDWSVVPEFYCEVSQR
jgi:hypothetical protein